MSQVRATKGVSEGSFYFEVSVEHLGQTGCVRLGVGTQWAGTDTRATPKTTPRTGTAALKADFLPPPKRAHEQRCRTE